MRLATGLNLAFAVLVASTSYAATVTWVPSDVGTSTYVVIENITPAMPGLAASVDLQLTSFSSTAFAFTATLHNDSDPSTTSRLSVFGFNVDSPIAGADVTGVFSNPGFVSVTSLSSGMWISASQMATPVPEEGGLGSRLKPPARLR